MRLRFQTPEARPIQTCRLHSPDTCSNMRCQSLLLGGTANSIAVSFKHAQKLSFSSWLEIASKCEYPPSRGKHGKRTYGRRKSHGIPEEKSDHKSENPEHNLSPTSFNPEARKPSTALTSFRTGRGSHGGAAARRSGGGKGCFGSARGTDNAKARLQGVV